MNLIQHDQTAGNLSLSASRAGTCTVSHYVDSRRRFIYPCKCQTDQGFRRWTIGSVVRCVLTASALSQVPRVIPVREAFAKLVGWRTMVSTNVEGLPPKRQRPSEFWVEEEASAVPPSPEAGPFKRGRFKEQKLLETQII